MTLAAGTRLGPYEVVASLGSGGMGEVYRALDTRLGREVAMKILPSVGAGDSHAIERFRREVQIASSLSHPHICAIYDLGEHDGRCFFIMELLEGHSLRAMLNAGPIPVARALEIAIDVADGLDAAHQKGIVHRDIKPANLFVTSSGRAKVVDFGVAKLVQVPDDAVTMAGLTQAGEAVGTVAYMSPEQARGGAIDARTDLFSLGLVLYEMLSGRPVVTGGTMALLFDALLNRQPTPLRESDPRVPADVDAIVARLLAKAPAERYQTAAALLQDLRAARGAAGEDARSRDAVETRAVRSVAVLPFASLSSDPENEYLADGITEEVIGALGRLQTLHVPGRISCFAFKGQSVEIREVAARLNVANVLTGSVRRSGARLRIAAELVNADNGFQLWSERFDRTADDVFAIQDEIATSIAGRLQATLSPARPKSLIRRPTDDLEAYAGYLKGRFFLNQRGQGVGKALEAFKQALALDPDFVLALAGLAEAYALAGFYGDAPVAEVMPLARAAAMRAIELDPLLAEPHAALQMVHLVYDWDWVAAHQEFERALALNPNAAGALLIRAVEMATAHGRFEEAYAAAHRAIDVDPLSPYSHYALGQALMCGGRYADSIVPIERALELHPAMWIASRVKGVALSLQGRHDEALASLEHTLDTSEQHPWLLANMIEALDLAGRSAEAVARSKAMIARAGERYIQPSVLAYAVALVEGMDAAFVWLERAYREHDLLPVLNHYPSALLLKRDPRWPDLMRRIGLEPAPAVQA